MMLLPVVIGLIDLKVSRGRIRVKEFLIMEAVAFGIVLIGFFTARYTSTLDTEIWSGQIINREQNSVPCSHSYSCNCHQVCTGSGKDETCSQTCDTCYEHSNDYDWDLQTNIGSTITIDRVDRQGVDMPSRWAHAYIGEPVAVSHLFKNYIKANPKTVLTRFSSQNPEKLPVPDYPVSVYDYYRVDRFLAVNYQEPYAHEWNWLLNRLNGTYGSVKQINIIVVAVKTASPEYQYLLEQKWLGGKKNDLVIMLGVPEYPRIAWVRIMSWSKSEGLKVELRDQIQGIGTMGRRDDIVNAVEAQVRTNWQRRHMREFEYLMAGAEPGPGVTILLMFLSALSTIGLSMWFAARSEFEN